MRQQLLKDRYLAPGETDERQIYDRVGRAVYPNDQVARERLTHAMESYQWLPNTPTLVNAGRPESGGLSACYVLPIYDSLDGIYKTVWDAARVHKSFGGTGFNFSNIRGAGSPIKSTGGKACGPIKVMELLNTSAGTVMQGGKREGANMGILNDYHSDIHSFIRCKDSGSTLSHFNISVGMHDASMRDDPDLVSAIAEQAWKTGDPGIIFLDRLNEANLHTPNDCGVPVLGDIDCTNPCGEQPLRAYESCNLGSINLSKYPEIADGDYSLFMDMIRLSVETLDRIIDINKFPILEIAEATLLTRKIGSGVMGWADWLITNGYSYQSQTALNWIDVIGQIYRDVALEKSHNLAKQYGNYPAWGDHPAIEMRNETLLTIAPTGTLSYLADCSWGIEPVFNWEYKRDSESGSQSMKSAMHQRAKDAGLLGDVAQKISPEWQIRHVAAWQSWVDNGVSKTINLPASATVDDVIQAFKLAWQLKCKGITIYRDGTKDKQVINSRTQSDIKGADKVSEVVSHRKKFPTGCGNIRVDCAELPQFPNVPYEVIVLTSGGCKANNAFTGKLISKYIHDPRLEGREIETVKRICDTAHTITCDTAILNKKSAGKSCADIIAKYMEQRWLHKSVPEKEVCPQCGAPATFGLGCRSGSCTHCGWSGCT